MRVDQRRESFPRDLINVAVVANLKVERCVSGGRRMIPMTHGPIRLVTVAAPRLCRRQGFVACQPPHLLLACS